MTSRNHSYEAYSISTLPIRSAICGLLLLVVLFTVGCGKKTEKALDDKPRSVPVRTAQVEQRSITEELILTGTIKPLAQVQVVSEVSARLMRVNKDEGSAVTRGEVIAVLDNTDYRLSNQRAAATVAVAEANRAHALAERDRANNLLKTGGITDKDHLSAQVNLQVAEASLAQARAEAAIAAQQFSRCEIRAPFSGKIMKRMIDPGAMLAVGAPVFTLVDNSVLEFRSSVPSADFEKIHMGAPVRITVDSMPGFSTQGQVARIMPMVDERSRSFEVVVRVNDKKSDLISGLFARAAVKVREVPDALVVPPSALVRDGSRADLARTFVIENDKAESREVGVGVEGADTIQVIKGLKAGMHVVVDPPIALASGANVTIQNSKQ